MYVAAIATTETACTGIIVLSDGVRVSSASLPSVFTATGKKKSRGELALKQKPERVA
eukprot:COSAG02_NODE_5679_length_4134_cov_1.968773_3_plen_57_part_00